MYLDIIIGFIAGICLSSGVITVLRGNKKMGVIQLILTIISPILIYLWCKKKTSFVFGGTDWEFLVQTAMVDKTPEPWLILILYIVLICITIFNIVKVRKK